MKVKIVEPRQTRFRLGHIEELVEEDGFEKGKPIKVRYWRRSD
jgi:hypothetical protein